MYNYDNFAKVKEEIDKKRQNAMQEADTRAFRLRAMSDEIRAIDDELSGTGFALFKAACNREDINPIKEKNLLLQAKKKELIKALGYPEDYAEIKYSCKKCSDTGYTETGAMCSCFKEALIKAAIASSGMGLLIEKQSFDNFDLRGYEGDSLEKMEKNLAVAKDFAYNFGKAPSTLVMLGTTGTGKTHLSSAIARVVIEKGFDVIYDSSQNIMNDYEDDRFRSGYGPREAKSDKYTECDLLIIDDLGTEYSTPFSISSMYNLINTRQNRGLSTIISTNLPFDALAKKYEDRIFSRIIGRDSKILNFTGKDRRIHRL